MTDHPYITFRCPPALRAQLEKLAAEDDRSISYVIKRALEQHVATHAAAKRGIPTTAVRRTA